MTTCEQIETSLTRSLSHLIEDWPDMLEPPYRSGPAKAAAGNPTLADDQADTDADTDWMHRVVSLRREITEGLNGWARVVMEDRGLTATLPPGNDAAALAGFLLVHAQWFSGHEAAEDAADELRRWAHKARMVVAPSRREWMPIGDCPVTVADADGNSVPCGSQVRAYPGREFITCRGCGTEDTLAWWMSQIVGNPDAKPLVTAAELISIVARDLDRVLTDAQIRQWARRNHIPRAGRDAKGRVLYDHIVVVALIREGRACA